jgi:hypothetical protein
MENTLVLSRSENLVQESYRTIRSAAKTAVARSIPDRSPWNLAAEGGEFFNNYISRLGYGTDQDVLILSSKHHYYYDASELKEVKTLVNLKRLNFMKHLENYVLKVSESLSPNAKFIGCFEDKKANRGIGITARLYKKLINFIDLRIDTEIDRKSLVKIFESCGFDIVDMTEVNGLTYFTSSKCRNCS